MASEVETLRTRLSEADFEAIVGYALGHKRVLSFLTALTYDQDHTISWRAVEALGLAAAKIADTNPEYVRVHLRRLIWLLNDESGGIGWRAPEAIGEIIRQTPSLFEEFIPILVNLMDTEPKDAVRFRAGWLWAIGRLAAVHPEEALAALPWITPCLNDPDPQVRGSALWCLSELNLPLPEDVQKNLIVDQGQVETYISPNIKTIHIHEMARALAEQS
jgi:hypothetical protein